MITIITRETCKLLSKEIEDAVRLVAERHGLVLSQKGGNFSATSYQPKFELSIVGDSGMVLNREAESFRVNAQFYGLKAEHLGATFTQGGRQFTICGLKGRSPRLPILAKSADGRTFKFNAADVVRALGLQPSPGA